ncbi:MAG TPA: DUF2269 family protein [Candidatus Dormibacteraeota bacterium]
MSVLFSVVKFLHILFVITAVGSNITYGFWQARTGNVQQMESFVLRGVKWIDDHVANPAYGLVLVTGLIMAAWRYSLTTHWIVAAIVLYVIAIGVALAVYSPALARQIEILDKDGIGAASYRQAATRATVVGIAVMVPILVIIFLMISKPSF